MTVQQVREALNRDELVLLDIRSREEWKETGVAHGAWPVSLHERSFGARLSQILTRHAGKPIALICATGGRSQYVQRTLLMRGIKSIIDIPEGMLGSRSGPGWIRANLPVVSMADALAAMPPDI